MVNNITMIAFTFLVLINVIFFVFITIVISQTRKEYRDVNKRLSDKIDNFERVLSVEFRELLESIKDFKK